MREPKEGELWTVTTERIDPETHAQLASVPVKVIVARMDPGGPKKGINQKTGKEYEINVPPRVHFRYVDDEANRKLGIADLIGTYELTTFVDQAKRDGD